MGKRKAPSSLPQNKIKNKTKRRRTGLCSTSQTLSEDKMTVQQFVQKVQQTFAKSANQNDAVMMKKYMRNQFEFFGIKSPTRRSISKEFLTVKFTVLEVREIMKSLWLLPQRELQYFGIDYLDKHMKSFGDSLEELYPNLACIEYLIVNRSWWDTVDCIASHVGYLVKRHPEQGKALMEKWIDEENMWLRRTALLHQLSYKQQTDEDMLYRFCVARAHEKEFFIQKAMGWALRQYARTKPSSVKAFLCKNKKLLSNLTYREAAKHLKLSK